MAGGQKSEDWNGGRSKRDKEEKIQENDQEEMERVRETKR